MNKVTTVNLNGKAYQVEEKAYTRLHDYLERARMALHGDPDSAEIIADLEQSIADKSDPYLTNVKDVMTDAEVERILQAMGPVEATDAPEDDELSSANHDRPRKFYLIKEGAMLAGVCNGLAAYFGVDVTVVRLLFVLLTFLTGGGVIAAYIIMAIVVPKAGNDEQLAEAYGRPTTAQEVIDRVKERATNPETLDRIGSAVMKIWRILARLVTLVAAIVVAGFTAGWIMTLWAIALGHAHFQGNLAHLNSWYQVVFVTAAYLLAAILALLIARLFNRVADSKQQSRVSSVGESSMAVLWGVALVTVISLAGLNATDFNRYTNAHQGYLDIGSHHVCVDDNLCHPVRYHHGLVIRENIPAPPEMPTTPVK